MIAIGPRHRLPRRVGTGRALGRLRGMLAAAATLLAATGLAVAGSGATYALWNVSAAPAPSVLSSGTATMTVSQPSAFALLAPGATASRSFVVSNTGDAALRVEVTAAAFSGALADSATVQIRDSSSCSATATLLWERTPTTMTALPDPIVTSLAKATSRTLCLSVTIASTSPATAEGGSLVTSISIAGRQP